MSSPGDVLRIGRCDLDRRRRVLQRDGREIAASGLALALLCELAAEPGEVVASARIRAALWPGVVVEESALRRVVRAARRLLGDEGSAPVWIETIRGRGLRLSAAAAPPAIAGQQGAHADPRAPESAALDRELARLDADASPDGAEATARRVRLAEAAAAAGQGDLARSAFRRAAQAADANAWREALARAALGLAGSYVRYRAPDPEIVAWLERAHAAVGSRDDGWRARLGIRLATEHTLGDLRRRRTLQRAALAAAERSGDAHVLAAVLLEPYGQLEDAVAPARRDAAVDACVAARAQREARNQDAGEFALGVGLLELDRCLAIGALHRFDEAFADVDRRARRDGRLLPRWGVALRGAQRALLVGRFGEAESRIEAAFAIGQQLEHGEAMELFLAQSLLLRVEQGRARELAALRPLLKDDHPSASARCLVAWALLALGDREAARRLAAPLLARPAALLALQPTATANAALLAELAAALDVPGAASALEAVLAPHGGRNVLRGLLASHGPTDRYRALAAWLRGDLDTAWRHSEAALTLARGMEATPSCARIHLDRARILAARRTPGDATRVRAETAAAERLAERAGIEQLAERAARFDATDLDEQGTRTRVSLRGA